MAIIITYNPLVIDIQLNSIQTTRIHKKVPINIYFLGSFHPQK